MKLRWIAALAAIALYCVSARAQQPTPIVAGVVTADVGRFQNFKINVNAIVTSVVLSSSSSIPGGQQISLVFTENATGGFAVTFGGNISNPCTVSATANATTVCQFQYDATANQWNGVAGGGSGSSSPVVTVSNNCGSTPNCFPVANTARYVWDATIPNASSTWTTASSDPPFVAGGSGCVGGDVGCYIAATNGNVPGYNFQLTSVTTTPTNCTITAVNSAHSVNVSCTSNANSGTLCNATSQVGCMMVWGPKETAAINTAWNAAVAACARLQFPGVNAYGTGPSVFLWDAAIMNTTSTGVGAGGSNATCSLGTEGMRRGLGIQGKGLSSTIFIATPDMNFASWTFGHTAKAGFGTVWEGGEFDGYMVFGMANSAPSGVLANQVITEFLPIAVEVGGVPGNMKIGNIGYMGYGAGSSGIPNCIILWGGSIEIDGHIEQDGCGKIGVEVGSPGSAGGQWTAQSFNHLVSYDNWQSNLVIRGNNSPIVFAVDSHGGEFGTIGNTNSGCLISVQSNGTGQVIFSSFGDHAGLGSPNGQVIGLSGALCLNFGDGTSGTGPAMAYTYGSWFDFGTANGSYPAGEAVFVNTNATLHACGTLMRMSGAASQFGLFNSGTFYADCPNQIIGNTGGVSGTGVYAGQNSLQGSCSGVGTASSTLGLYGLGQFAALTCTSTVVNLGPVMDGTGSLQGIKVTATAAGTNASSGVVTVLKNGSATSITCTIGTGTSCSDFTHVTAFAAGDVISAQFTTQVADTLAGVKVSIVRSSN